MKRLALLIPLALLSGPKAVWARTFNGFNLRPENSTPASRSAPPDRNMGAHTLTPTLISLVGTNAGPSNTKVTATTVTRS